jgi:hypothetical protein
MSNQQFESNLGYYEECLQLIKKDGFNLSKINVANLVQEQINNLCIEAVSNNGFSLSLVKFSDSQLLPGIYYSFEIAEKLGVKRDEIFIKAVKQNGYALQYVRNQKDMTTSEICTEAVKQNSYALEFVDNQTVEICLLAVRKTGKSLCCVKDPKNDKNMKQKGEGPGQTEEICLEAVKEDGMALAYVKNQTVKICLQALYQNDCSRQFVKIDLNGPMDSSTSNTSILSWLKWW